MTLGEAGRRQEPVTVARAALSLGQEVGTADTGDRRRHIAEGHDLLADSLAEVGRQTEALEHSVRAVSYWEELAAGEPAVFGAPIDTVAAGEDDPRRTM
ncbi:hypothetical protein [Nocardia carnea]|uniref:hypothetical protein n=1 Tax=Nocardia carnea TaxID=37328 RepID=UPI00245561F0|nr:hypothetical protein [Nocardia carnea]